MSGVRDEGKQGTRIAALALLALLAVGVGCGSGDDGSGSSSSSSGTTSSSGIGGSSSGVGGSSSGVGGSSSGVGGSSSGVGGSSSGVGGSSSGAGGSSPSGLDDVGTLVVLGDSISDGGGQPPYYYNLLHDALDAHYGKSIGYHNRAQSGSQTSALVGQINGLPGTLEGPVAVTITSGGNDMKANLALILAGLDAAAKAQMGNNISAALDALLAPDRFGAGVEVFVFQANIYDASDGVGNFQSGGCTINVDSPVGTDPFFDSWNGEITSRVNAVSQTLADMHGLFYGHGFNNPPTWYAGDCTHPNSTGHAELEGYFFTLITGQAP